VAEGAGTADLAALLAVADRGLYRAKGDGRACARSSTMLESGC